MKELWLLEPWVCDHPILTLPWQFSDTWDSNLDMVTHPRLKQLRCQKIFLPITWLWAVMGNRSMQCWGLRFYQWGHSLHTRLLRCRWLRLGFILSIKFQWLHGYLINYLLNFFFLPNRFLHLRNCGSIDLGCVTIQILLLHGSLQHMRFKLGWSHTQGQSSHSAKIFLTVT
jgi:hypothetical protein